MAEAVMLILNRTRKGPTDWRTDLFATTELYQAWTTISSERNSQADWLLSLPSVQSATVRLIDCCPYNVLLFSCVIAMYVLVVVASYLYKNTIVHQPTSTDQINANTILCSSYYGLRLTLLAIYCDLVGALFVYCYLHYLMPSTRTIQFILPI